MEADNTHTILINLVNVCTDNLCQPQEITRNPVRYKHIIRQKLTQNSNIAVTQCCILKVNPSQCRQCRTLYITGFTTFVHNNATTTAATAFIPFSFTWSSFFAELLHVRFGLNKQTVRMCAVCFIGQIPTA